MFTELEKGFNLSIWLCKDNFVLLNDTYTGIHIINPQILSMGDKESIYIKIYTYVKLPVKTNMVGLKYDPAFYSSLDNICARILGFQSICPLGIFRVFQIFHCFSTYFNSLNFSQSFSWVYVSTPVYFPSQGTRGSCVSRTFNLNTIHQGQSFVTGDL